MNYQDFKKQLKNTGITIKQFAIVTGYSEQSIRDLSRKESFPLRIEKLLILVEKAKKYDEMMKLIQPSQNVEHQENS